MRDPWDLVKLLCPMELMSTAITNNHWVVRDWKYFLSCSSIITSNWGIAIISAEGTAKRERQTARETRYGLVY